MLGAFFEAWRKYFKTDLIFMIISITEQDLLVNEFFNDRSFFISRA